MWFSHLHFFTKLLKISLHILSPDWVLNILQVFTICYVLNPVLAMRIHQLIKTKFPSPWSLNSTREMDYNKSKITLSGSNTSFEILWAEGDRKWWALETGLLQIRVLRRLTFQQRNQVRNKPCEDLGGKCSRGKGNGNAMKW